MRRRALLVAAAAVVVAVAPMLAGDPDAADFGAILRAPSWAHPLGTDQLGRDLATRLVAGARLTLGVTALTVLVTGVFGIGVGLLAGYLPGALRAILLRAVDTLAALPLILFGLVAAAVAGPGLIPLLVSVWLVAWTPFARQTYQLTAREMSRDYVTAAASLGARPLRILLRHLMPNIARPLVAHACVRFASTLLTLSGLSFLGLGVQPPAPEWGAMVAEGRDYLFASPWPVLVPSVAVVAVAATAVIAGRRGSRP